MLFHHYKKLGRTSLALVMGLLLVTSFGLVAQADDTTAMTFSLGASRDANGNFVLTVSCQNNTSLTFSSVYAYLPLDSRVEYQYYNSSSQSAYVRRAVPERLEIAFDKAGPGACPQVQVVLKRVANSRGSWTVAATGHWDGEPGWDGVQSNEVTLDLSGSGAVSASNPGTLQGPETASAGESVTFSGSGYFSNEKVSLWINLPDGRVVAFSGGSTTTANSTGQIQFTVQLPADAPSGPASIVAFGQSSNLTGLGFLTIS